MKRTNNTRVCMAAALSAISGCLLSTHAFAAPPTAPGMPSGSVIDERVNLQWEASQDDNFVSGYNVYLNESYVATVFDTEYSGQLDTSRENVFYIIAFDRPKPGETRGYSERSAEVIFRTSGEPPITTGGVDRVKPSVPDGLVAISASSSSISFRWAPSTDNVRVVGYNVYRQGRYIQTVFTPEYIDADPLPGVNSYSIVAFDQARNYTQPSNVLDVNANGQGPVVPPVDPEPPVTEPPPVTQPEPPVDPENDVTAPSVPVGLSVVSATADAITITWDASTDDVGVDGYSVYRNGRFTGRVKGATRYVDTRVPTTGTRFTYSLTAYDKALNFSARSSRVVATTTTTNPEPPVEPEPPVTDATAPSIPSGLSVVSATTDAVTITWNASTDNVGVAGYSVFRNGRFIGRAIDATRYVDRRVPSTGTRFTYALTAYDEKFNFSARSAGVVATIVPAGPTEPVDPEPPGSGPEEMVPELDPDNRFASPDPADPFGSLLEIDPEVPVIGGAPTTPKNLRADLVSNNWAEMSWAPSNDDVGVVAYNIYRDDGVNFTISPDQIGSSEGSQAEIDKYWSTTSFIDCNYTRFDMLVHNCAVNQPVKGETYVYRVSAVDTEGQESQLSNPLSITYHLPENAPVPIFDDFYKATEDRFAQSNDLSETRFFLDEFDLVFNDEFRGTELNPEKWQTELTWGDSFIINGEQQYFVSTQSNPDFGYDPFSFDGEVLTIGAIPTPENLRDKLPPVCDIIDETENERCLFLSGALSSFDRFSFLYGYAEANMKVGGTPGMLSSFLLYHRYAGTDKELNAPEIDILEYLGENPFGAEDAFQTYHFDDVNSGLTRSAPTMSYANPTGELYSEDFHTFGVLWEPQLVIWYIDGQEVQRMTGPMVSRRPMNIINYLVTGSVWAPTPDLTNPDIYPLELDIDYIRVYQRDAYKSTASFGP